MPRVHYASTHDTDMFYLVREGIYDPFFYIDTGSEKIIFLNNLEIDAFTEHNTNPALTAVPVNPLLTEARALLGDVPVSSKLALLLFQNYHLLETSVEVSNHMPLSMADYLRTNGATLLIKEPFVPERAQKTSLEVAHIRESIRRTCKAFERIEEVLRVSEIKDNTLLFQEKILTSEDMKKMVSETLFREDMENANGLIISCGSQAALPHHAGSGPLRPHETIVCDIFPRHRINGYFADMTRTYVKGTPTKEIQKMYDAVKNAQDRAQEAVTSGVSAKAVHEVSVKVICDAGFEVGEKGYTHGLGHGLGLDVHEAPSVGPHSEAVLKTGNVITIEPGLYYPKWGGVRLEDVVLVTENSYENLTNYKRELVIQ